MKKILFIIFLSATFITNGQLVSIADIQGYGETSPYNGSVVSTKGIVTAAFSGSYFIQDGDSAWSGLYVYDNTQTPTVGDSIEITGTIEEYYDLTEIKNLTSYTVINSGNTLPTPIPINTGDATEQWESVLISFQGATCTNPDLGYGEWEVNDGTGPAVINDLGIAYSPTEGLDYNISGPLDYSYSAFKIEPRDENDIQVAANLFIVGSVNVDDIDENYLTLSWETNTASTTEVEFGLTPDLEIGTISEFEETVNHTITIDNLAPNQIYYIKPYSVSGPDTTITSTNLYTTESTSTGEIKVYFNHSVETLVATGEPAVAIPNGFTDTIISYINKAQSTLDITMYDIVDSTDNEVIEIFNAINSAYNRGVTIRYITDDLPENELLDMLNPGINILRGNTEAIMHDKFIIIDAESIDNSWVMTGSTNHTIANLNKDYNNIICIQDNVIAKAYTMEFNEMWGSTTDVPNESEAKFGSQKTDNTPHHFKTGERYIEVYFSPSDNTTAKIVDIIEDTQYQLEFALLVFTENSLGQAILDAHNRGVDVHGIVDYTSYSGDEASMLATNGVDVLAYQNEDGSEWPEGATLHHKYAISDFDHENATLITGSHNWSASAESINDENTVIIHDAQIANYYHQEFIRRYNEQRAILNINNEFSRTQFTIYPNPSNGTIYIDNNNSQIISYRIYNLFGQVMDMGSFSNGKENIDYDLASGVYLLELSTINTKEQVKFVVQ